MDVIDRIRRALTSGHVLHMEAEIAHLRGQVAMLQLQLLEALKPKPAPPAIARQFPKFTPAKTSWEAYLAAEIAKQEAEEVDGIPSSGRQ